MIACEIRPAVVSLPPAVTTKQKPRMSQSVSRSPSSSALTRAPIRSSSSGLAPLGDHLGEVGEQLGDAVSPSAPGGLDARAVQGQVLQRGHLLHPRAEPVPVGLRDAPELGEHEGRHGRGVVGVQVDGLAVRGAIVHLSEPGAGEGADRLLQPGHLARREAAADQAAQPGVHGGVEHHQVGREAELADLVAEEGHPTGRGERLRFADGVPDVLEPRERPERRRAVVGRAVVDGILVAQQAYPAYGSALKTGSSGS